MSVKTMDNTIPVDKAAHRIFDFHITSILSSKAFIDGEWRVFYHEERLYSVFNSKRSIISLVYANSPHDAIRRVKNAWKECEENEK
jgi:hypothetical protein